MKRDTAAKILFSLWLRFHLSLTNEAYTQVQKTEKKKKSKRNLSRKEFEKIKMSLAPAPVCQELWQTSPERQPDSKIAPLHCIRNEPEPGFQSFSSGRTRLKMTGRFEEDKGRRNCCSKKSNGRWSGKRVLLKEEARAGKSFEQQFSKCI